MMGSFFNFTLDVPVAAGPGGGPGRGLVLFFPMRLFCRQIDHTGFWLREPASREFQWNSAETVITQYNLQNSADASTTNSSGD